MAVALNGAGKSHAMALIIAGHVDKSSGWGMSADDENKILGDNKWGEYGKWFLGADASADKETKAHWHYPFGKEGKVYRSALIAIRQRAGQQSAQDIYDAAGLLLDRMDGKMEGKSAPRPDMERRTITVQIRADAQDGHTPTLRGTAAVFDSMSEDLGGFREIIAPGAFRAAVNSSDVRCLVNHDPNKILGRSTSGTLRLEETSAGLEFVCDLPDTTYARDLMESMKRGDISQCSFGFTVDEGGQRWAKGDDGWTRTITAIKRLYDVSPVTYPAYPETGCALRAMRQVEEETTRKDDDLQIALREDELRRQRLRLEEAAI